MAYKLVDVIIGLRVPEDEEREGLDLTSHGEVRLPPLIICCLSPFGRPPAPVFVNLSE